VLKSRFASWLNSIHGALGEVFMFKRILIISAFGVVTVSAQVPPPGTISGAPRIENTQSTPGNSFTNRSGSSFSTAQLGSQLQQLRSLVEQTLPVLVGYTETVSNTAGTANRSVGGTVTDLLSGVLNRRGNQQNTTAGNNVFSGTNVVNVLQGLLNTNANNTTAVNTTALKDLGDLQSQLQAINSTLQRLNITGTNSIGTLTPTGR
jgi:hypothetical protein